MKLFPKFNDNIINFICRYRMYIFIVLLCIISFFVHAASNKAYSQQNKDINFPRIENVNDTLVIIFTYEQGQRIEADLQLLGYYKELAVKNDQSIQLQIEVINEYNDIIFKQKQKIDNLDKIVENYIIAIVELNKSIELKNKEISIANEQISKLQLIVKDSEKKLKKEKRKNIFTYVSSSVVVVGTILFFVFK